MWPELKETPSIVNLFAQLESCLYMLRTRFHSNMALLIPRPCPQKQSTILVELTRNNFNLFYLLGEIELVVLFPHLIDLNENVFNDNSNNLLQGLHLNQNTRPFLLLLPLFPAPPQKKTNKLEWLSSFLNTNVDKLTILIPITKLCFYQRVVQFISGNYVKSCDFTLSDQLRVRIGCDL